MDELRRTRSEMHRELNRPGERPAASIRLTRRTFLHRSLMAGAAAGAATYGWFPLINTFDVAYAQQTFKFAWISDTHLYPRDVNTRFVDKAVRAVKEAQAMSPPADFLIFGGDLAQLGDPVELDLGAEILKDVKIKKVFIPGEHDWYLDMGAKWTRLFGASPWSFDHKGVRFVGLDTPESTQETVTVSAGNYAPVLRAQNDEIEVDLVSDTQFPVTDELARRIGLSASLISQIESGQSKPSVSTLYSIVTELTVSLDDIFKAYDVRGVYPSELDEDGAASFVRHILKLGTRGIGITWLTGEFWSLTSEERKRIAEITVENARGKALVAVHTSHTSLKECIALTQHAQDAGADFAVLMPPYIIARTLSQVADFFKRVAAETDLGILIFNTPQSGCVLKPREIAELAQIPSVCGVKVATQNVGDVLETHQLAGDKIVVSAATDEAFFYQDFYGFRQQVLFANPCDWMFDTTRESHYVAFVEHACRGEMAAAAAIYRSKINSLRQLFRTWMKYLMPKYGGAYPTQFKKAWAELMGLPAGPVRSPLLPLTDEEKQRLGRGLIEARRQAGLEPPPGAL